MRRSRPGWRAAARSAAANVGACDAQAVEAAPARERGGVRRGEPQQDDVGDPGDEEQRRAADEHGREAAVDAGQDERDEHEGREREVRDLPAEHVGGRVRRPADRPVAAAGEQDAEARGAGGVDGQVRRVDRDREAQRLPAAEARADRRLARAQQAAVQDRPCGGEAEQGEPPRHVGVGEGAGRRRGGAGVGQREHDQRRERDERQQDAQRRPRGPRRDRSRRAATAGTRRAGAPIRSWGTVLRPRRAASRPRAPRAGTFRAVRGPRESGRGRPSRSRS